MQFFPHAEGYVKHKGNNQFMYAYQYKDHLGNVRLSYADINGNGTIEPATEILEENNYYPFGLKHNGYNEIANSNRSEAAEKYKFQGQERNEELGLNWDSFKWRNYDYAIGRFMNVDPLTMDFPQWSPYVFSGNYVTMAKELEGMEPNFMINNGKLSQGIVSVLNAAFGYSPKSLSNTVWITETDPRITILQDKLISSNKAVAVTDHTLVAYGNKYIDRSNRWWFGLIGHEQKHRHDINKYGGGVFYSTYILEGARTFGNEDKMLHEAIAYKNEEYSLKLWDYNSGEVNSLFNNTKMSKSEINMNLKSVGNRFRRDVILSDEINHTNGLIQNANNSLKLLGNSKEDQILKSGIQNMINNWQQSIIKVRKEQDEITKMYGL